MISSSRRTMRLNRSRYCNSWSRVLPRSSWSTSMYGSTSRYTRSSYTRDFRCSLMLVLDTEKRMVIMYSKCSLPNWTWYWIHLIDLIILVRLSKYKTYADVSPPDVNIFYSWVLLLRHFVSPWQYMSFPGNMDWPANHS